MKGHILKLNTFSVGIALGIFLGFWGGQYLITNELNYPAATSAEHLGISSASTIASRLFPEISILDIYGDKDVIETLRDPKSVTIYSRNPMSGGKRVEPLRVGDFQFNYSREILSLDDKSAISDCLRSVNSLEVGYGYPCLFDPTYLIRFSKPGSSKVDFLLGRDCYIVEWYYNENLVKQSISRFKINDIGRSIVDAILMVAGVSMNKN